tara:strand:+ start:335 stop:763 length:429 start_codon:yes stop_codon:yes gene_type:complete
MANKKQKYHSFIEDGIRCMECKKCGCYVEGIGKSALSVLCDRCLMIGTLNLWNPFIQSITNKNKKPKGWHWMKEFVDKDGNVFHKGKEVPELKGTLSPTKIKKTVGKKKKKKESYEKKINMLAKKYKQKQKSKKEHKIGINK